jgi:hypothetical protein
MSSTESTRPYPQTQFIAEGSGGVSASMGPQGLVISDKRTYPIWAIINGNAEGTNRYAWVQLDDGDIEGDFGDNLAGGFGASGTAEEDGFPAYEINGNTLVPVDGTVKVLLTLGGDGTYWLFSYKNSANTSEISDDRQDPVDAGEGSQQYQYLPGEYPYDTGGTYPNWQLNQPMDVPTVLTQIAAAAPNVAILQGVYTSFANDYGYTRLTTGDTSRRAIDDTTEWTLWDGSNPVTGSTTISAVAGVITQTFSNMAVDFGGATVTGLSTLKRIEVTMNYNGTIAAAATSNDVEIYSLPLEGVVFGAALVIDTPFTGGGLAVYQLSVGITGVLAKYVASTNAQILTQAENNGSAISSRPLVESYASATSVRLAATCGGANLNAATAGSARVYLYVMEP